MTPSPDCAAPRSWPSRLPSRARMARGYPRPLRAHRGHARGDADSKRATTADPRPVSGRGPEFKLKGKSIGAKSQRPLGDSHQLAGGKQSHRRKKPHRHSALHCQSKPSSHPKRQVMAASCHPAARSQASACRPRRHGQPCGRPLPSRPCRHGSTCAPGGRCSRGASS